MPEGACHGHNYMICVCKSLVHALRYVRPGPVAGGPPACCTGYLGTGRNGPACGTGYLGTGRNSPACCTGYLGTGRKGSAAQTTDTACWCSSNRTTNIALQLAGVSLPVLIDVVCLWGLWPACGTTDCTVNAAAGRSLMDHGASPSPGKPAETERRHVLPETLHYKPTQGS